MICNKCKQQIPDDCAFCEHCGTKITHDPNAPVFETPVTAEPVILADPVAVAEPIKVAEPVTPVTYNTISYPLTPAPIKTKFCSNCGAVIDFKAAVCNVCGKNLKSAKTTLLLILTIILAVAVAVTSVMCVIQESTTESLKEEIEDLEDELDEKEESIETFEQQIVDLNSEINSSRELVNFIDNYVVFIENDGSDLYHKFDCSLFKGESFWVYNISAAQGEGYYECSRCH